MALKEFVPTHKQNCGLLASLALSGDAMTASVQLEKGFDFNVIADITKTAQFKSSTIIKVPGIDKGTLSRHLNKKARWVASSATRIYNTARIIESALDLFNNDRDKAEQWLNTSAVALNNISPADYAKKPLGQEAVLDLIGRIKHGIVI